MKCKFSQNWCCYQLCHSLALSRFQASLDNETENTMGDGQHPKQSRLVLHRCAKIANITEIMATCSFAFLTISESFHLIAKTTCHLMVFVNFIFINVIEMQNLLVLFTHSLTFSLRNFFSAFSVARTFSWIDVGRTSNYLNGYGRRQFYFWLLGKQRISPKVAIHFATAFHFIKNTENVQSAEVVFSSHFVCVYNI